MLTSKALSLSEVRDRIRSLAPDVFEQKADRNFFFFAGAERKHPFATIVTHDDDYDSFSALDESGFYRISAGVRRTTFARSTSGDGDPDFKVRNTIAPNPIYGKMFWLSVLSPDAKVFQKFEQHLRESYSIQSDRTHRRADG